MISTGSPLVAGKLRFRLRSDQADVDLASISGGTDICSCFVLGNPLPQSIAAKFKAQGLAWRSMSSTRTGSQLPTGKGELVCTKPFPSMPVGFWNDPDGAKYHNAYFERFPGVWHHGDFAEWTEHGGIVIQGRSDATLNPGGVRIGTAEIYRQVEQTRRGQGEPLSSGRTWIATCAWCCSSS